jgi:hypothetical protein
MDDWIRGFWSDLAGRPAGPFGVRFILQPLVAAVLGVRDGLRDARSGRPAFFWTLLTRGGRRRELLAETWTATGKVFVMAFSVDVLYQVVALDGFHPLDALAVAAALAFAPYLLIRGPVNRLAGRPR